jgi:hypothetical protein
MSARILAGALLLAGTLAGATALADHAPSAFPSRDTKDLFSPPSGEAGGVTITLPVRNEAWAPAPPSEGVVVNPISPTDPCRDSCPGPVGDQ